MFQLKVQKIMDFENIRKWYNGRLCVWGVCVCVCAREREREREMYVRTKQKTKNKFHTQEL